MYFMGYQDDMYWRAIFVGDFPPPLHFFGVTPFFLLERHFVVVGIYTYYTCWHVWRSPGLRHILPATPATPGRALRQRLQAHDSSARSSISPGRKEAKYVYQWIYDRWDTKGTQWIPMDTIPSPKKLWWCRGFAHRWDMLGPWHWWREYRSTNHNMGVMEISWETVTLTCF